MFGKSVLVVDKSTDHDKPYFDFYVFMFFYDNINVKENVSVSERELNKALRDTLTRAAWLRPSNFWLVRSDHAHASYPGLFFRPPGFSSYMGREERRVQGLDYATCYLALSISLLLLFFFLLVISYFPYFKFVTFKTRVILCNTLKKEGRAFRNIVKYTLYCLISLAYFRLLNSHSPSLLSESITDRILNYLQAFSTSILSDCRTASFPLTPRILRKISDGHYLSLCPCSTAPTRIPTHS